MRNHGNCAILLCTTATWLSICAVPVTAERDNDPTSLVQEEFFERKVRPLLARRCYACHSQKTKQQGELTLDRRSDLLRGGSRGPVFRPGKPQQSLLIQAIRYEHDELAMPPSEMLPQDEIDVLTTWVRLGAVVPEHRQVSPSDGRRFWSFQLPQEHRFRQPEPTWIRHPIDAFVFRELRQRGLAPNPAADRRTLIRRATFDLTGLPPTSAEVDAFVADDSPDAYPQLIDRLLGSPQYGARWARFWLDLARYTDTTAKWLKSTGQAWLYRDWVVRALNNDLPFDTFAKYQLASDLMPSAKPEDLAALGFLGLSPTYWKELRLAPSVIRTVVAEEWDERIDAVSRTFLGLTVACARCHDHKFDPIRVEDYYALAGVFASTQLADRPLLPDSAAEAVLAAQERVDQLEAEIEKVKQTDQKLSQELKRKIAAIQESTLNYDAARVNAVVESSVYVVSDGPELTRLEYRHGEARDLPIFLRGNPEDHGSLVQRRFLEVLSSDEPRLFRRGSGRLELAEAIFREGRPLSARVIVNRIWREHFGRGLVDTPSNFGMQGQRPSHPELLDHLTTRFVAQGWSLKWLHREIMLSASYRRSSSHHPDNHTIDPNNRWLWRTNRQRLGVEMWRDAMLAVAGELDLAIGGASADLAHRENWRRTIYGTVGRRELNDLLRLYDFPSPTAHSPARELTITPLQQLFVLNGDFLPRQAEILVRRVQSEIPNGNQTEKVRLCYELIFARQPTMSELQLAEQYLAFTETAPAERDTRRPRADSSGSSQPATGSHGFSSERRWQQYVHVLLGLNEFMFLD